MSRVGRRVGGALAGFGLVEALFTLACIEPPPIPPRRDAGLDAIAAPDGGGGLLGVVSVRSFDGRDWPLEAIPRRPVIELQTLRELDEGAPVYLFAGAPSESLRADLMTSPLRSENLARAIPCEVERGERYVVLRPPAPIAAGATLSLAVGAWASFGRERLGAPYLLALTVSRDPEAGAMATTTWPPDGASDVSVELWRAVMRFDGGVPPDGPRVTLLGEGGPVAVEEREVDCGGLGLDGLCVAILPTAALSPLAAYRMVPGAVLDATGAPLAAFEARFRTAPGVDRSPPELRPSRCALDEAVLPIGCVLLTDERAVVRATASEPVLATLRSMGGADVISLAPRGEVRLVLRGLVADELLPVTLEIQDLGGLRVEVAAELDVPGPLPAVSIAEALLDPEGREPAQEYVELFNEGTTTVDLEGFHLSDAPDREGDALAPYRLSPGARVLVVADAFDADAAGVPLGAPLLRIGTSLGESGLSNEGEPLLLRDAAGHRVSETPALAPPEEGACLVRRGDRRSDDPRDFDYARSACSPITD